MREYVNGTCDLFQYFTGLSVNFESFIGQKKEKGLPLLWRSDCV